MSFPSWFRPTRLRRVWGTSGLVLILLGWSAAEQRPAAAEADAPVSSVDLRPILRNWGLEPRAQGGRGTCSVFVVDEAIEFAWASRERQGTRLSVEFLNWASNQAIGQDEDGGFFSDLWKGFTQYGLCPETDFPYRASFDPHLRPTPEALSHAARLRNGGLSLHWIKPWDVTTGLTPAQVNEIKQVLRRQWPVGGGLRWPKQERWDHDVLQMAPPEGVRDGHSVLLVGFRDDPAQPGGGVFLIQNSGGGPRDAFMTYEYASHYMNDAIWIDHDAAAAPAADAPAWAAWLSPTVPPPNGRNRRVSSNQQPQWHSENLDMTWLMPGESVEMPLLEGPGVITHIWLTSHAGWVGELNALRLRIYWDGSATPGIEAPLGDFFAVGQGKPAVVDSVPVQVSPTGALTCYWRMPFRRSARILVTNDNPDRSTGLYWQVDWVQVEALPADTPHFYARYRQEYPAVMGRDYTIARLEGQGQYVGTVLAVTVGQDGWFGEGDDFFYIDGETVPSLQGTGSEDYFNDAWGFRPRTSHWFGQPRWQGDRAGDSGVAYRWHLADPVRFTRSLEVAIEHKGNRDEDIEGFFLERPDFFSSVAFWYQTGEPKPFAEVPPWPQRRVPWESHHLVQALPQSKSSNRVVAKVQTTGFFGARPVVVWPNRSRGATLTFPFTVAEDGRYAVRLTAGTGPDQGAHWIKLDGKPAVLANFRAVEQDEADLLLGTHTLAKGPHAISLQAAGGPEPVGPLTVEMLRCLRLPPEATRAVRTHHEAHFIRLGIGRAVYAYRLAFGKLPDSLETLVKAGILPSRLLKDENELPLKARIEGGEFVVESHGPEPWSHRWQGLDARR